LLSLLLMMIHLAILPPSLHLFSSTSSAKQGHGQRGASVEEGREGGTVGGKEGGRIGGRDADIVHHVARSTRNRRRKGRTKRGGRKRS
jgi:hypothetical protein